MATYLREINDTPLLTKEDERTLAEDIQRGDAEARKKLISANLRLVVSIARAHLGRGMGLGDLIEEGNVGLVEATKGFDTSFDTRFSTYASYWIKKAIKAALMSKVRTIRIPPYLGALLWKWREKEKTLMQELGRKPTFDEVGKAMALTKKRLALMKRTLQLSGDTLTESSVDDRHGGYQLEETAEDRGETDPGEIVGKIDMLAHMPILLETLTKREHKVLTLRFGLDGREAHTLEAIGKLLGITRERIRQIEADALGKLRKKVGIAAE